MFYEKKEGKGMKNNKLKEIVEKRKIGWIGKR